MRMRHSPSLSYTTNYIRSCLVYLTNSNHYSVHNCIPCFEGLLLFTNVRHKIHQCCRKSMSSVYQHVPGQRRSGAQCDHLGYGPGRELGAGRSLCAKSRCNGSCAAFGNANIHSSRSCLSVMTRAMAGKTTFPSSYQLRRPGKAKPHLCARRPCPPFLEKNQSVENTECVARMEVFNEPSRERA